MSERSNTSRRRALAQLKAEHEPQPFARGRIRSEHEPQRPSRKAEEEITANVRRTERNDERDQLAATLTSMRAEFERVQARLGYIVPGDHRGYLREIDHGLAGIERLVERP